MREEDEQKLMNAALRALSRRAHTIHEMREKLQKRDEYTQERSQKIIARLIELRLLNDEDFLKRAIESLERNPQGLYKFKQRMLRKGLSHELISKLWQQMQVDEEKLALLLEPKIQRKIKGLEKHKARQKAASFLAGRGFSSGVVMTCLDQLL